MDLIENDYRKEITSQSQAELAKLSKWQKDNHNDWSTVIGGWAVWSYYPLAFGSRDIDLVLPIDDKLAVEITDEYFPNNDIDTKFQDPFGEKPYYSKTIQFGSDKDEIIFDLFYPKKPRPDPENLGVTVDWSWAFEYSNEQPISDDAFINVPEPELLLPLKMVGALARIEEMRFKSDTRRIRSKIWKDYYDVAILTNNVDLDPKKLEFHMRNIGINKKLRQSFLNEYINRSDILERANVRLLTISGKLPENLD